LYTVTLSTNQHNTLARVIIYDFMVRRHICVKSEHCTRSAHTSTLWWTNKL